MKKINESENETIKDQSKLITSFVNEFCVLDKDNRVKGTDLHNKYIEYCKVNNIEPLELITFYKELDKVCGKQIIKSRWFEGKKRVRGFDGIDIKK